MLSEENTDIKLSYNLQGYLFYASTRLEDEAMKKAARQAYEEVYEQLAQNIEENES
jgi:hypothetical protein